MDRNREILREQKIGYYGKCTSAKERRGDTIEQGFYEELKAFEDSPTLKALVISDEDLSHNDNNIFCNLICELQSKFDVKVICYLREVVSYYVSFYCFASIPLCSKEKAPPFRDFSEYLQLQKSYISIYRLLVNLVRIIPIENIIARPFHKKLFRDQKIENDFFDILSVDASSFETIKNKNISPTLKQAEKIYYALSLTSDPEIRQRAKIEILRDRESVESTLTKNELNAIHERYYDYEIKLHELFFNEAQQRILRRSYDAWNRKINYGESRILSEKEKKCIFDIVHADKKGVSFSMRLARKLRGTIEVIKKI